MLQDLCTLVIIFPWLQPFDSWRSLNVIHEVTVCGAWQNIISLRWSGYSFVRQEQLWCISGTCLLKPFLSPDLNNLIDFQYQKEIKTLGLKQSKTNLAKLKIAMVKLTLWSKAATISAPISKLQLQQHYYYLFIF